MRKNSCKSCYYFGSCDGTERCEYFHPVTEDEEDRQIHIQTEEDRAAFYDEWFQYVSDFSFL